MVFAHPPHEWFAFGMLLARQPDIFFLSRGPFHADPTFDDHLRNLLAEAGFHGTLTFCDINESDIFEHYLQRDIAWFQGLRDEVSQWLNQMRPEVIFSDAFESYNSAHDLAPLLVDMALQTSTSITKPQPRRFELCIGMLTLPNEEYRIWVDTREDCLPFALGESQFRSKLRLWSRVSELMTCVSGPVNDAPAQVTSDWPEERFRVEYYREVSGGRDYRIGPRSTAWLSYDERGLKRVRDGRSRQAILFADHFVPIAEALLEDAA